VPSVIGGPAVTLFYRQRFGHPGPKFRQYITDRRFTALGRPRLMGTEQLG
jgi:hypothetical protein